MKFFITENCLANGGEHAEAGTIIEVSRNEAQALLMAGRGYVPAAALPGAESPAPVADTAKPTKPTKA